jgi:hypothetical protein
VYSADQVALTFAGIILDSGFADGEFVSIEMAADDFGLKVGADGEGARFRTNNRSATIKVKLLQTSQGNDRLSQLRQLDLAAQNGAGVGAFELNDLSSGVRVAHAATAWISHAPTVARAREVVEYEWTLMTDSLDLDPSGNPTVAGQGA